MTETQDWHARTDRRLASASRTREWQSWCEEMRRDITERTAATGGEIEATFAALARIRLATDLFCSALDAELKHVATVSTPEPLAMLRDRIGEAVCEGLTLSHEAAHVFQDEQA